MPSKSARLALVFSCLGHAYMHLFAAFYFVIVLQLEREWALPYHQVIELWTLGALLVGLCAIPASSSGWLYLLSAGLAAHHAPMLSFRRKMQHLVLRPNRNRS